MELITGGGTIHCLLISLQVDAQTVLLQGLLQAFLSTANVYRMHPHAVTVELLHADVCGLFMCCCVLNRNTSTLVVVRIHFLFIRWVEHEQW